MRTEAAAWATPPCEFPEAIVDGALEVVDADRMFSDATHGRIPEVLAGRALGPYPRVDAHSIVGHAARVSGLVRPLVRGGRFLGPARSYRRRARAAQGPGSGF